MDFGQAVQIRAEHGAPEFRYFRMCGKDYYRAPEAYMPPGALQIQAQCPAGCTPGHVVQVAGGGDLCNVRFPPEAEPGQIVVAQMYGYAAAPLDMFACGVTFFILHAQAPPFPQATFPIRASNTSGSTALRSC